MPVICITQLSKDTIAQAPELQETTLDPADPRRWCLLLNQSALPEEGGSPSVLQGIPLGISDDDLEEIRWYLEDYAQHNPFERSRASRAKDVLLSYGKALAEAIEWKKVIRPHEWNESLVIRIFDMDEEMHHVVFEILEDPQVWGAIAPPIVYVIRSTQSDCESDAKDEQEHHDKPPTNILVVAARPESDEDVPHRLVSRVLLDKIQERRRDFSKPVTLTIVRPSTWEAFKIQLDSHPSGFFDIVHFDMHGIEDEQGVSVYKIIPFNNLSNADPGRTRLAFIKPSSGGPGSFQPDLITATSVGKELARAGVDKVVLNACRSAKGRNVEKNVALSIVGSGIQTCVAMSYKIVARAVELFTAVLYDCLLLKNLSLDAAARMARGALRAIPARLSGFGDTVMVDDWVVPVVYQNSSLPWRPRLYSSGQFIGPSRSYIMKPPIGREADILQIESALLIAKRSVLLVGPAGIGKTCLLEHLCSWWKKSGLVLKTHYVQFSKTHRWDLDDFFQELHQKFFDTNTPCDPIAIVSYLKANRCLIVFDSLESIDSRQRASQRRLHRELPQFLHSIDGGSSFVILASRANESWLSADTITHDLRSIGIVAGMHYIRFLLSTLPPRDGSQAYDSIDDQQYLEQLIKLVDGNPLAITLVTADFICSRSRPREYLYNLLVGASMMDFSSVTSESNEGCRSVAELSDIIDSLNPDGVSSFLPVQILAMFWKLLPQDDLPIYAMCYNRKVGQKLGLTRNSFGPKPSEQARGLLTFLESLADIAGISTPNNTDITPDHPQQMLNMMRTIAERSSSEEDSETLPLHQNLKLDDMFLSMPDFDIELTNNTLPLQITRSQCTRILDPLIKASYLREIDEALAPPPVNAKNYLSIHPLLPILLRSHMVYRSNFLKITEAIQLSFSYYYSYRVKKWPFRYQYFNPVWNDYSKVLDFEFYNFLGAAATYMEKRKDLGSQIEHGFLIRMLLLVHRGVKKDPNRLNLVRLVWEKALESCLHQEQLLMAQRPSSSLAGKLSRLSVSQREDRSPGSEGKADTEGMDELNLFSLRSHALQLCLNVYRAYADLNSDRKHHFLRVAKRLGGDLKDNEIPKQLNKEYWNKMLDFYTWLLSIADGGTVALDEMWAKRQEYMTMITKESGEVLPESQKNVWSLPMDLLSQTAHSTRTVATVLAVRQARREGRPDDALKLIDKAWRTEVFDASNDSMNKAELLELRAEINERKGQWEDALSNFDEAHRLRVEVGAANGRPVREGFKETFKRNYRRQELLRKIKAAKSYQS